MVRYLFLFIFISLSSGQLVDELDVFYSDSEQYLFSPDSIVKSNGFWYLGSQDKLFTGRLNIYSKDNSRNKLAECTIVNGVKNGIFMQYYDQKEQIRGIMGLYVDDIKEGTWTWIEPSSYKRDRTWEATDLQTVTSIEYRNGIKHASLIVYKTDLKSYDYKQNYSFPTNLKVVEGNFLSGKRQGNWYFYDDIFSDFDLTTEPMEVTEASVHWSRKEIYYNDMMIDNECREPWSKWIDCEDYESKYTGKIIAMIDPEPIQLNQKEEIQGASFTIKDNNGVEVKINIEEFYMHIEEFHTTGDNIHKQGGHSFTINDALRNKLYNYLFN